MSTKTPHQDISPKFPETPESGKFRGHSFPKFPGPPLGGREFGKAPGSGSGEPLHHQTDEDQDELRRLLNAAMLACQFWNDSPTARAAMRRQLCEVPPGDRQTWTEHFQTVYGTGGAS